MQDYVQTCTLKKEHIIIVIITSITCLLCLLNTLAADIQKIAAFLISNMCAIFLALVFSLKNRPRPGPHSSDLTSA